MLKSEPFDSSGESLWDPSLIYIATEFGRTRSRPERATEMFGTGHDLNNGFMILSPMVRGNTVLGGVDPRTTLTYSFDPRTGAPEPGKVSSNEADIFSGILTAMGVDTSGSGLPDASAFRRTWAPTDTFCAWSARRAHKCCPAAPRTRHQCRTGGSRSGTRRPWGW